MGPILIKFKTLFISCCCNSKKKEGNIVKGYIIELLYVHREVFLYI
jgi:hypothetical protein